jgi:hypothetical protein
VVAGFADQVVEAGAFAAEDEDAVAGEVELVVVGCAALVESDDPEVLAFEVFEGADEVDDAGDAEMLGGAGAGLDGDRAEGAERRSVRTTPSTPAPSATRSSAPRFCGSSTPSRARSRRREPVAFGGRVGREQVFDGQELLRADEGDDALMGGGLAISVSCSRDSWRTRMPAWRQAATRRSRR